jgi:hypothetical protein
LWHIITAFPEVLTSKLSLTHLLENHIQLIDAKPVKSPLSGYSPLTLNSFGNILNSFLKKHYKTILISLFDAHIPTS